MRYNMLLDTLQNLIKYKPSQKELGEKLCLAQTSISGRANRNSNFTDEEIQKLERAYNISILPKLSEAVPNSEITSKLDKIAELLGIDPNTPDDKTVSIKYLPNVYLSAGYGVEVYDETTQTMTLDSRLLVSEKGLKIDPKHCEIVRVSGNSMEPEYRNGDRVIVDRNDTTLSDGHIYAFRYKGECYVKEINLLGNKIKCIPLNKEYDTFYINSDEEFMVIGRILPRIRL